MLCSEKGAISDCGKTENNATASEHVPPIPRSPFSGPILDVEIVLRGCYNSRCDILRREIEMVVTHVQEKKDGGREIGKIEQR